MKNHFREPPPFGDRYNYYATLGFWPVAAVELLAIGATRLAVRAGRLLSRAYGTSREIRQASALGIPTPDDLRAVWAPPRRTLRQALLIGSKMVDLSATHRDTLQWDIAPNGKRRIAGRAGGLRRYFAAHCPDLAYSTAMRYRKLALRLLRVLDTPTDIPLEWLLSNAPADTLTPDPALADSIRAGRRALAELLADIRTQRDLSRALDRKLDPDRLPNARRLPDERDAAACDAILARLEARLRAAEASGQPLSPREKRARAALRQLKRLLPDPPQ